MIYICPNLKDYTELFGATEYMRGEKLCSTTGKYHLKWYGTYSDAGYFLPTAFFHGMLLCWPNILNFDSPGDMMVGIVVLSSEAFAQWYVNYDNNEAGPVWCFQSITIVSSICIIRLFFEVAVGKKKSIAAKSE
jgi:hypothetical protein